MCFENLKYPWLLVGEAFKNANVPVVECSCVNPHSHFSRMSLPVKRASACRVNTPLWQALAPFHDFYTCTPTHMSDWFAGLPANRVRRILPAEKLAEFGTFSGKFHACLVCG